MENIYTCFMQTSDFHPWPQRASVVQVANDKLLALSTVAHKLEP